MDAAAWSAASWLGDAGRWRKGRKTPACTDACSGSKGAGIKGKRSCSDPPNSQEEMLPAPCCSGNPSGAGSSQLLHSPACSAACKQQQDRQEYTAPQLSSLVCNAWLWQHRPGKTLGCRVGKGGHGEGKRLSSGESSPGTKQAGTGSSVMLACRQGAGSQRPARSHAEASVPAPQLPAGPG